MAIFNAFLKKYKKLRNKKHVRKLKFKKK